MACDIDPEDSNTYLRTTTPKIRRTSSPTVTENITPISPVSARPGHLTGARNGVRTMRGSASVDSLTNMCKVLSIDERTLLDIRQRRSLTPRSNSYPSPPPTPTELSPQLKQDPKLRELAQGLDKIFSNNNNNNVKESVNNNSKNRNQCYPNARSFRRQNTK
ncbi:uncharacterized protein LOC144446985 [Glandiceps talaboti]